MENIFQEEEHHSTPVNPPRLTLLIRPELLSEVCRTFLLGCGPWTDSIVIAWELVRDSVLSQKLLSNKIPR